MNIEILYGLDGAKNAKGIVVIVDVYRAASVASYALEKGVKYIIPVTTVEEALALKTNDPNLVLIGEVQGIKIKGFDFGNSPHELINQNLFEKIVVHRTSAGTQGLVNANRADICIFGSFPTVSAIARYIKQENPKRVSIVAMDGKDSEDNVFAEYLKGTLLNKNVNKEQVQNYLKNHEASARFLDPTLKEFPIEDINYCLDIDRFDFVCLAKKQDSHIKIVKYGFKP